MTENKRFIYNKFDIVGNFEENELKLYEIDNNPSDDLDESNLFYVYSNSEANIESIVDKLNTLVAENEQLKADNNRLVNETAKIIAEHQRKVFDLIDEKIKEADEYFKQSYDSWYQGKFDVLTELKKGVARMTERYIIDDAGTLIDMQTRNTYDYVSEICPILNELDSENKALKQQLESEHQMLDNAILLERTRMGQNALKQYKDNIME